MAWTESAMRFWTPTLRIKSCFKGRDIAYALTGAISDKNDTFNLLREVDGGLKAIASADCHNGYELIQRLATRLKDTFDKAGMCIAEVWENVNKC